MASTRIKSIKNDVHVKNNVQPSRKRSLLINSSNPVDKKKPETTGKRYKSLLTCVICNGDAHGYNFDAISCESCKAFFRRNALRPLEKLKCRSCGHCDVTFDTKKRCKKCRLEKCLRTGMRKEWILSDKEKEEKRTKVEENRRLKQMHDDNEEHQHLTRQDSKTDDDLSLDLAPFLNKTYLNDLDWSNIRSIQNSFIEAVKSNKIAGISFYPSTQAIESTLELFRVPLYISSMRLISYIKQLSEFQQLDKKEQVYIVKLNLLTICFFHSIFIYDPRTDSYHEEDTTDPLFSGKDWMKTLNTQFHIEMNQLRNDLLEIFQMDNIIIKLFFLILLFSHQLSRNQVSQYISTDINSVNIYKAQNVFADLVYKYCLHQYGPYKAPILFTRYINKIMKIQQLVEEVKYTTHAYMDITQLSPLTQSLIT